MQFKNYRTRGSYMGIGIAVGVAIGAAMRNVGIGIMIGVGLGGLMAYLATAPRKGTDGK